MKRLWVWHHVPSRLPVSQHQLWCYISSQNIFDHVSSLQIFPRVFQCQQCIKQGHLFNVISEKWLWPPSGASPSSLLSLFWWVPKGLVQLSAPNLMGTGGWGSSAFSSPLGMTLLAQRQHLGRPPQWATQTQPSPVGALSASGWPKMKYGSQLWNIAPLVEKSSGMWSAVVELFSARHSGFFL